MLTVLDNLKQKAAQVQDRLRTLMSVSSVHREPTRRAPGLVCIGYSAWHPLSPEGKQAQSRVLEEYRHFYALLHGLLRDQPTKVLTELKKADGVVMAAIQQTRAPQGGSPMAVAEKVVEAIDAQLGLVGDLYGSLQQMAVYVPDTNALLHHPQLEDWRFADSPRFAVVLLPTVLKELDGLKVNHRNQDVRVKAEGLIRRIKGYRQRGRLTEGVPLRNEVSTLVASATEPDLRNSLPWLDPMNDDDRILAGFVEIVRQYPHAPVVLVTRDINLQNKAEFAGLVFVEPPDPA